MNEPPSRPTAPGPTGAEGFDDGYWRDAYGDLTCMDGIMNAEAHAAYLKASFDVVLQPVHSVVDMGFGLGRLFEAVLHALAPFKALGIEPSGSAFEAVRGRALAPERTNVALEQVDLASWCRRPEHPRRRFDLGLCTSVWQYLDDDELEAVVPVLARRLRWLYLTVPTAEELDQQVRQEHWVDRWAHGRCRAWYRELLRPHFVPVGARLLESRERVAADASPFTDHLFRGWG